jgi:hypothetical protein
MGWRPIRSRRRARGSWDTRTRPRCRSRYRRRSHPRTWRRPSRPRSRPAHPPRKRPSARRPSQRVLRRRSSRRRSTPSRQRASAQRRPRRPPRPASTLGILPGRSNRPRRNRASRVHARQQVSTDKPHPLADRGARHPQRPNIRSAVYPRASQGAPDRLRPPPTVSPARGPGPQLFGATLAPGPVPPRSPHSAEPDRPGAPADEMAVLGSGVTVVPSIPREASGERRAPTAPIQRNIRREGPA